MKKLQIFLAALSVLFLNSCNPFNNVSNEGIGPIIIGAILILAVAMFIVAKLIGRRK